MSRKKIAILQSNYIPWKGYFDLINMVDEFILYDDMQYTKNDWRNRNQLKTPKGVKWLTIPVLYNFGQTIKETKIANFNWNQKHWKSIIHNYSRTSCFKEYKDLFEDLYLNCQEKYLSFVNYRFLSAICQLLGIKTKISWSMDYDIVEGKTEKLVDLCKQAQATEYISGQAAKDYIQPELFAQEGINLSYIDYSGYSEYNQLFPPFEHGVTILDLIFNEGINATKFMKSF